MPTPTKRESTARRWGKLSEFNYYVTGLPLKVIAKRVGRSTRTVSDWIRSKQPVSQWAVAFMRLDHLEYNLMLDQMGARQVSTITKANAKPTEIRPRPAANDDEFVFPNWRQASLYEQLTVS